MDKIKKHMEVKQPVRKACYSQDITPQERRTHMKPIKTTTKKLHGWAVPGKEHPTIKRKVG